VHDKIRQAPVTSIEARNYLRVFLSGASDELPDKQGRVTVPAALRQYADLGKDLVVIGVGSRAEIWNATAWAQYLAKQETEFANVAQEVIPGLF
jgi:MraZ protein